MTVFQITQPGELPSDTADWPQRVTLKRLQELENLLSNNLAFSCINLYEDYDIPFLQLFFSVGFLHLQNYILQTHPCMREKMLQKSPLPSILELIRDNLEHNPTVYNTQQLVRYLTNTGDLFHLKTPKPAELQWLISFYQSMIVLPSFKGYQSLVIDPFFIKEEEQAAEEELLIFLTCLLAEKTPSPCLLTKLEPLLTLCHKKKTSEFVLDPSSLSSQNPLAILMGEFNAAFSRLDHLRARKEITSAFGLCETKPNRSEHSSYPSEERHSQIGKGDEEDRWGGVVTSPNAEVISLRAPTEHNSFFQLTVCLDSAINSAQSVPWDIEGEAFFRKHWLSIGDLIYGLDNNLKQLAIYKHVRQYLKEYYTLNPLGCHKGGIAMLLHKLFQDTEDPFTQRLCQTFYKTWWYAKEQRGSCLSLVDRLGEWYAIELLIEDKGWTLSEKEFIQIIKSYFRDQHPNLPFRSAHITRKYFKLIKALNK